MCRDEVGPINLSLDSVGAYACANLYYCDGRDTVTNVQNEGDNSLPLVESFSHRPQIRKLSLRTCLKSFRASLEMQKHKADC